MAEEVWTVGDVRSKVEEGDKDDERPDEMRCE